MKTLQDIRAETNVPAVVSDHQGMITFVNDRFIEVFGWTHDEVIGSPLLMIIPKNLHDAHNMGFSRFIATGKPKLLNQPLMLKATRKDTVVFDAEHLIVADQENGEWVFGATIKPV